MKKTTITTSGNFHKKEYEKLNKTEQYVDSGEKIHTTSKHDIKSQVVGGSGTVNTASFAHNVERMNEKNNSLMCIILKNVMRKNKDGSRDMKIGLETTNQCMWGRDLRLIYPM